MSDTAFIITRYGERIYENSTAWTAQPCRCFNEETGEASVHIAAVKVQIISIHEDSNGSKSVAVAIDDSSKTGDRKFFNDFFAVQDKTLFTCEEDAREILVRQIENTTDGTLPETETEGWNVGDTVYVYNDRKHDVTEGTIIEIQKNRIHANAVLRTTIPDEAYMFENRDRRGNKLVCRVDILHRSPDRNEW